MRWRVVSLAVLLLCGMAFAQSPPVVQNITAQASSCFVSTTSTACVFIQVAQNTGIVAINVGGTYSGTLQFEGSGDGGSTWNSVVATPSSGGAGVTSTTSTGLWQATVGAYSYLRVRCSAYSSGTANITLTPSKAGSSASSSGSGVGSGAAPAMAFYLSNQCPASNTGNCFNTPADTQVLTGCTWTSGNATVTCASGTFAATDVGKTAFGYAGNCNPFQSQPLAGALTTTKTTIQTFTDSAHVVMAATASASAAGTGCLIWGHPDDAGAVALSTALASLTTAPQCPKVFLAAAGYMFLGLNNETLFWQNPPACTTTPATGGAGSLGNLFYAAGYEIEGRGAGTTILWLPPDFPETGSCTHGNLSTSCFAVPLEGRWSDLQISGGSGASGTNVPNGNAIINVDVGSLDYVTLTNLADGFNVNSHTCVQATHWAQLQQVNVSACGDVNMLIASGANATCFRCSLEVANSVNASSSNLNVNGSTAEFSCYQCNFFGTQTAANALADIVSIGGTLYLYRPHFAAQVGTNQFYYQALTTNGSKLFMQDGLLNNSAGVTNLTGLFCNVTCTLDLIRNTIVAAGTGAPLNVTGTNSTIIDRGGNSFSGGSAIANYGTYSAPGHAVNGACTGVGTAASTLGLFGTGPNVTATACTSTTIGSGITMAYPGTLQSLIASASAAGTNASSGVVTVLKNGAGTTLTCTIGTGTACVDGTHTVSYVAGDLISLQFTTQAADTLAGVKAQVVF